VAKNIVIVESPAKARTIGRYLGKDYEVTASLGHVRDLPIRDLGVDLENDFKPKYTTIRGKGELLKRLKKLATSSEKVFLACDLDREGEAIAWHLKEALKVPSEKVRRVTFNEITKSAILKAFKNPGKINLDKVNAQQARRILDRLVGYKISPLLWKRISKGLSAGRVQSVAVRLIVDRERAIRAFKPQEYWRIHVSLAAAGDDSEPFKAEVKRVDGQPLKLKSQDEAAAAVAELEGGSFRVAKVSERERRTRPLPPFSTSLMQQQASIRLGFAASKTMRVAQQLYEGLDVGGESTGLITYMRTDSFHVNQQALDSARSFIESRFGSDYLPSEPRRYRAKGSAQEAHEAIRPTDVKVRPDDVKSQMTSEQYKLYRLIWQRFVASQMADAVFFHQDVTVEAGRFILRATGDRLKFDGHLRAHAGPECEAGTLLPHLKENQQLHLEGIEPSQHFTQPPPRYSEATLVKALESKGIGRPSTYAPIIATIQQRLYVGKKRGRFFATDLGMVVTDKLVQHFPRIMDVDFTSRMESDLDEVEAARKDWLGLLREFYDPFEETLQRAEKEMKYLSQEQEPSEYTCPDCGLAMVYKWGKRGRFLACTGYPECRHTASIDAEGKLLETKVTEHKCSKCGKPMVLKQSRRGPFLACSGFPECRNTLPVDKDGNPKEVKQTDKKCPKCGSPMVIRSGRRGEFLACSAYPKCRTSMPLDGEASEPEIDPAQMVCEKCGGPMTIKRKGSGRFLACSNYPECKNTRPLPTGVKCPREGCDGMLVQRYSKKTGRFYGCSKYPECEYVAKELPAPETDDANGGGQAADDETA